MSSKRCDSFSGEFSKCLQQTRLSRSLSEADPRLKGTCVAEVQTFQSFCQYLCEMKRVLLKLVAVFEVVSGLAGMYAVVTALVGIAPAELAPMLWYGIFPLASVLAGVMLWRFSRFAVGLSIVIQSLQIPLIMTENLSLNLGAIMKLSFSGIWCAGDECRVRVVLGINILALVILIILLSCKSEAQMNAGEVGAVPSV